MVDNSIENKVLEYRRDPEIFFNMGLKYAEKRKYARALKFLNEAVSQEPYNADYRFNLACIQSEMKLCKESNNTLLSIIKNIDPTLVECYFGVACNYFDMGNLKKAKEYIEKYVATGDEGEFIEVAYDILHYLQVFEEPGTGSSHRRRLTRLLNQGKELINTEAYKQACLKFEKAVEIDPFQVSARNYLALACFLDNEVDKAVSVARSVLKIENENVFARCNLALFYDCKDMIDDCNQQLNFLLGIELNYKEDFRQYIGKVLMNKEVSKSTREKIIKALSLEKQRKNSKMGLSSFDYTGKQ